jgi:hypothetical protein
MKRDDLHFSSVERGIKRYIRNPSANELRVGVYLPRLTVIQRPTRLGVQETLTVEFSAPKLVYGNNFDELTDNDLPLVITKLQSALKYMGVVVPSELLAGAKVVGWHPSKNIVYGEYFASQTVINTLHKADVSLVYSLQKTDFTDGEILHFHCNSKDIAFYDKLADLLRSRVSDKRAVERHNQLQHELIDTLAAVKPLSVLRFEIRFNSAVAVRRAVRLEPRASSPTFEQVFSSQLSQRILLEHWRKLTQDINYLALDVGKPLEVLQNYVAEHDDVTPMAACAAVTAILVANQVGVRALRQTLDARFGRHFWSRLKPYMQEPQPHRFGHIRQAEQALEQFKPVHLNTIKSH